MNIITLIYWNAPVYMDSDVPWGKVKASDVSTT